MTKLKPCPFCGGEAEIVKDGIIKPYKARCNNADNKCCVMVVTAWFSTKQEAIEAWNQRAKEKEPAERQLQQAQRSK